MWDVAEWQFSISLQCQHCAVGLSSAPPRPAQPSCPYGRVSTQPRADPISTGGTDAFPPRAPQHLSAGNRAAACSSVTQSCLHSSSPGCSAGADPKAHMEVHTAVHIVRHVGRSRATHTAAHSPPTAAPTPLSMAALRRGALGSAQPSRPHSAARTPSALFWC